MAWQWRSFGSESVDWDHKDPSGASVRRVGVGQELDPTGADAGTNAQTEIPDEGALISSGSSYNAANPGISYTVDGIRVSIDDFIRRGGFKLQERFGLIEDAARASAVPVGYRWFGVSQGLRFHAIYDANWNRQSLDFGDFDAEGWGSYHGEVRAIYDSSWSQLASFLATPQNYAQGRERVKGDGKVPDINIKREYLPPCVQKYLSKFFGGQSLSGIEVKRDYLPPIAPSDAAAFANTGNLISFNKGEYQPNTKEGIALIGHEITHNFQARKYGDAVFGALYLGDSAALFYQFQSMGIAYIGNRFEKEAFRKQAEIEKDLAKNGNPCPP